MTFPSEESPRSTFFVIIKQDDTRFKRHYSQAEAFAEAGRLTKLEGKTFFICRAKYEFCPPSTEVEVRLMNKGKDGWRYDMAQKEAPNVRPPLLVGLGDIRLTEGQRQKIRETWDAFEKAVSLHVPPPTDTSPSAA